MASANETISDGTTLTTVSSMDTKYMMPKDMASDATSVKRGTMRRRGDRSTRPMTTIAMGKAMVSIRSRSLATVSRIVARKAGRPTGTMDVSPGSVRVLPAPQGSACCRSAMSACESWEKGGVVSVTSTSSIQPFGDSRRAATSAPNSAVTDAIDSTCETCFCFSSQARRLATHSFVTFTSATVGSHRFSAPTPSECSLFASC